MHDSPSDNPNRSDADRAAVELAEELANLSPYQREQSLADLHGVSDAVEESPDSVDRCLMELDGLLVKASLYPSDTNRAYLGATMIDEQYTSSRKFRLMFLRASSYDVQRACTMMFSFFSFKRELFGDEKLCKDITQEDLNREDRACLMNGAMQLLPVRSTGVVGRPIFFHSSAFLKFHEQNNMLRILYYNIMTAAMDEASQLSGAIMILYSLEPDSSSLDDVSSVPPLSLRFKAIKLREALPLRMAANHIVVDSAKFHEFFTVGLRAVTQPARIRFRFHHGSRQEVMYSLMTFGIPVHYLPINTNDGELKRDRHKLFVRMVKNIENERASMLGSSSMSKQTPIILPTRDSVLFGRGRSTQQWPGNIRLGFIVESKATEYRQKTNKQKTAMAKNVVDAMKLNGCRFLRQEDLVWKEVDDAEAREKVSNSFRGYCAKLDREEREKASSASTTVASGGDAATISTNATRNTPRKRLR